MTCFFISNSFKASRSHAPAICFRIMWKSLRKTITMFKIFGLSICYSCFMLLNIPHYRSKGPPQMFCGTFLVFGRGLRSWGRSNPWLLYNVIPTWNLTFLNFFDNIHHSSTPLHYLYILVARLCTTCLAHAVLEFYLI